MIQSTFSRLKTPTLHPVQSHLSMNYPTFTNGVDEHPDGYPVLYTNWHGEVVEVEELDRELCEQGQEFEDGGL